jgi:hypothetical protein
VSDHEDTASTPDPFVPTAEQLAQLLVCWADVLARTSPGHAEEMATREENLAQAHRIMRQDQEASLATDRAHEARTDPLGYFYGRHPLTGRVHIPHMWPQGVPSSEWDPRTTFLGNLIRVFNLTKAAIQREDRDVLVESISDDTVIPVTHEARFGVVKALHPGLREECAHPLCVVPQGEGHVWMGPVEKQKLLDLTHLQPGITRDMVEGTPHTPLPDGLPAIRGLVDVIFGPRGVLDDPHTSTVEVHAAPMGEILRGAGEVFAHGGKREECPDERCHEDPTDGARGQIAAPVPDQDAHHVPGEPIVLRMDPALADTSGEVDVDWEEDQDDNPHNWTDDTSEARYLISHPEGGVLTVVPDGDPIRPFDTTPDPWRMDEWHALAEECLIRGCEYDDIDQRGPVFLRDDSMHKACVEHWEAIHRVLGQQASMPDAMSSTPTEEDTDA